MQVNAAREGGKPLDKQEGREFKFAERKGKRKMVSQSGRGK
jgi:hypothetical protein